MASRVVGALAVAATATIASLALATPASAHTATANAACVKDDAVLSIELYAYVGNTNTILVKDGNEVLLDTKFGESLSKRIVRDGTVAHTFTVVVKASDDPRYNHQGTYKTPPCVEKPPVKPSSTPPSPSKPPVTSSTPSSVPSTPVSSVTPPPVVPTPEPPLANTGASTTWLLLSGLGLVAAGAATVLVVRRRRA